VELGSIISSCHFNDAKIFFFEKHPESAVTKVKYYGGDSKIKWAIMLSL
jgi:hypothetical protein